jgi:hypothetical protein
MVRTVVCHPQGTHEDYAIVSITALPANAIQFGAVQEGIHDFLEHYKRVLVREIHPSHLGQALVRFVGVYDRDNLVINSPHVYGDVQIHLVKHNKGRNWRAL